MEAVADQEAKTPLETGTQGEEHKAAELWRRFWNKRPDGMAPHSQHYSGHQYVLSSCLACSRTLALRAWICRRRRSRSKSSPFACGSRACRVAPAAAEKAGAAAADSCRLRPTVLLYSRRHADTGDIRTSLTGSLSPGDAKFDCSSPPLERGPVS